MKLAGVKGQEKFIGVLVHLEIHKLLGLAPERKQSEIEKVMLFWGDKVLSQVEAVSMDMSYSGSQKSEVCPMPNALCPMPYALCPTPVGYLIFLRKAI